MGTQEDERGWVEVANDLLSKCHINLRLKKLTDCDANVFVALYEAILGEKVPDYVATPACQEDDIHNVQSVIDSLALDYLQISLSHITGENIVRGDQESAKNLLEIFDGLLEYLNEEISCGSSHNEEREVNSVVGEDGPSGEADREEVAPLERLSRSSSEQSGGRSTEHSLHPWNADGTGSTAELIRLGDSARTFTANQEVEPPARPLDLPGPCATLLREPLRSAIPLQPPFQTTPQRSDSRSPASVGLPRGGEGEEELPPAGPDASASPRSEAGRVQTNVLLSPCLSPASERSASSQTKARSKVNKKHAEPTGGGSRRVFFHTQSNIQLLSLQNQLEATELVALTEEEAEYPHLTSLYRGHRVEFSEEECEETLSRRTQKNKRTEVELHHMSQRLAHRLDELDLMLKQALGESEEVEAEEHSHHSDSIMDYQRTKGPSGAPSSTRSLSPSSPRARRSLRAQLDSVASGEVPLGAANTRRLQRRRILGQMVGRAYEEELKRYEDRERTDMATERERTNHTEREYRGAVRREAPCTPKPSTPHPRSRQATPGKRPTHPRKPTPMKVKENDLLPLLLKEIPHLHLSPHTLTRMWKQQVGQVDRLHASQGQRHRDKLSSQVEEAQRRHDLLVEIIRKDQQHNRRLRDFKQRIQQQKSTQNRLREQRQQIARAKKYYSDYHVQLRARMMRERTREERMFKRVFEEGLELQKERLREQRAYAKDQRDEQYRRHRDEIQSMENYYRDQFTLLAEKLAQERQEIQVRKKAQEKALQKMKRELRSKMEREIGELQDIIVQNDQDDYFRQLEVERLRGRVQLASFQYSTSYLN